MSAERGTVFHISSTPWNFNWQAAQIITEQFILRGWQVLFVDPIPKRIPRLREFRRVIGRIRNNKVQAGIVTQREIEGVTYFLPKALPDRGGLARQINHQIFLPALAKKLRNQAKSHPYLVYITLATYAALDLLNLLQPNFVIYGCYLDPTHDPLAPKDVAHTEREIVSRSNLIIVDDGLANQERIAQVQPKCPVIPAPKTVSYKLFEPARAVRNIQQSDKPVCCYYGDLRPNVDVDLLRKVSHRYHLRFIGSRSVSSKGFSPDTEFLPPVPYLELPERLSEVDILLLPYRLDDPVNRAVVPAKTYECLAMGKPTIAIGLPSLNPLNGFIDIADDEDDFMALIENAVQEVMHPFTPEAMARREARLREGQKYDPSVEFERWFAQIDQILTMKASS